MRTNLATVSNGALLRQDVRRAYWIDRLVGLSLPVLVAGPLVLPGQQAQADEATRALLASSATESPGGCYTADQIRSALFPHEQIVAYDFTGADASKLKNVMDVVAAEVAPSAALVRLVLVPETNEAIAFQFGSDGCHTVTLDLNWNEMGRVFQSAGVTAPFGTTFYQMPGIAI